MTSVCGSWMAVDGKLHWNYWKLIWIIDETETYFVSKSFKFVYLLTFVVDDTLIRLPDHNNTRQRTAIMVRSRIAELCYIFCCCSNRPVRKIRENKIYCLVFVNHHSCNCNFFPPVLSVWFIACENFHIVLLKVKVVSGAKRFSINILSYKGLFMGLIKTSRWVFTIFLPTAKRQTLGEHWRHFKRPFLLPKQNSYSLLTAFQSQT